MPTTVDGRTLKEHCELVRLRRFFVPVRDPGTGLLVPSTENIEGVWDKSTGKIHPADNVPEECFAPKSEPMPEFKLDDWVAWRNQSRSPFGRVVALQRTAVGVEWARKGDVQWCQPQAIELFQRPNPCCK